MGYVHLRFDGRAGCGGLSRFRAVAGYVADWTRGGGASGFFCKPFYTDFRPVSFTRRSVGGRNWRHGGGGRGNGDRGNCWSSVAMDRELHDSVFHGGIGLPYCIAVDSSAESETHTCANWTTLNLCSW